MKLKYIVSLFFFVNIVHLSAESDSRPVKRAYNTENTSYSILPSGINVGFDLFGPIFGYANYGKKFHDYNMHFDIDFNRIYIDYDLGYMKYCFGKDIGDMYKKDYSFSGEKEEKADEYTENLKGVYISCGLSYNFLHKNIRHNSIKMGLKCNAAIFNDEISNAALRGSNNSTSSIKDKSIGTSSDDMQFRVCWLSVMLDARLGITDYIYIGNEFSFNFLRSEAINSGNTMPYMVPGWGREEQEETYKIKIYIGFTIPLFSDPKFYEKL